MNFPTEVGWGTVIVAVIVAASAVASHFNNKSKKKLREYEDALKDFRKKARGRDYSATDVRIAARRLRDAKEALGSD